MLQCFKIAWESCCSAPSPSKYNMLRKLVLIWRRKKKTGTILQISLSPEETHWSVSERTKISFVSHVVKRKDIHDFFWSVSLDQNYFRFNILQNTLNGCERIAASALTEPKFGIWEGWNKNKQKQFLQKNETWSDTKEWNSLPVGFQISGSGRCIQLFGWSGMFVVCLDLRFTFNVLIDTGWISHQIICRWKPMLCSWQSSLHSSNNYCRWPHTSASFGFLLVLHFLQSTHKYKRHSRAIFWALIVCTLSTLYLGDQP